MKEQLFITGIGTEIGKTICAAVLTQYLKADYWKPIQSGELHATDSMRIYDLLQGDVVIHSERYKLKLAASPHKSAALEAVSIALADFEIPTTDNHLVIEGAGGLFVPINDNHFMIDLIQSFAVPVALVVKDYLGCINHTLLSINAIKQRNLHLKYILFNGGIDPDSKKVISQHIPSDTRVIHIPHLSAITAQAISNLAHGLTL
ncbi:dethiobiotin synthase [Sphingobacterium faecium]|uniref:dethiobiotin synthase n=1 Tax=Sphingobacterium faecium TaxID=34087 RepID=UPI003DA3638C